MMKKVNSIERQRICKSPACDRILSIYNPDIYCYVCQRALIDKKRPKTALRVD